MFGLSDIPVLGDAIKKNSEATVEAGSRGLLYMFRYKTLVNQLNSEIENLKIQELAVSRKVDAASNDGKIIDEHVLKWLKDVENMKTLPDQLSSQRTSCTCFKVFPFPNLVSRFRLGRKAAHQSTNVAELTVSGTIVVANEVGYLPDADNVPASDNTFHSFASREEAYGKLWEALVDINGDPILAIYGMPGVGKTRMMEQAWQDAKDKNIFDKVARVNVSGEKLNVMNLQGQLASSLDCHLESKDNEQRRASQLKSSLMNGGKTLVILDDVWDVIPLNKVGIPFGDSSYKGCKILLTSRKQDVCLRNNCKDPVEIKTLTDGEAWEMFQNRVGSSSEIAKLEDASLAEKVCKKCAALPLLIDAVGNALKFVTENLWMDALYQLENHSFERIEGIEPEVYGCLQLSFEKLSVEARACLFLCSLFREDEDIEIEMLLDLATGPQLLDSKRNIYAVVDILKSSSLLLHNEDRDTVKLHDIIRDVARSIAARDPKYAFLSVRRRSWLQNNVDYPTPRLLQVNLEEDSVSFPDVCPDLHTLWLSNNRSPQNLSGFFERFMNLKFLVLQGLHLPDQQQMSIHILQKLKGLSLYDCCLEETFVSSISENIQSLCLWNYSLYYGTLKLPQLKDLRKLELLGDSSFNDRFWIKGIQGLSNLEELKLLGRFRIVGDDDDMSSILSEISQLTRLKILMIDLDSSQSYPDQDILNKLVKFHIRVGFECPLTSSRNFSKNEIRLRDIDIENGWMSLVERAEVVKLRNVLGLANGFRNINMREPNLRVLHIKPLFGSRSKLKYLFPATVAKCLRQLQQLKVSVCNEIEEIISCEEGRSEQGEILCFPKLKVLHLRYLDSLTSFYSYKVTFPNIEEMVMWGLNSCFCTHKIELGCDDSPLTLTLRVDFDDLQLVELPSQWLLHLNNIEVLDVKGCQWSGNSVFNATPTFGRLKDLTVEKCGYTSLFRSSCLTFLKQLEYVKIANCPVLEEILWDDEPDRGTSYDKTTISLPRLQSLTLEDLPKLKNCGIFACNMPALKYVSVSHCGFSSLFTSSAFTSLQRLSSLEVTNCYLVESIVEDEMHDETPKKTVSLSSLKEISLKHLLSLKSFSSSSIYALNMPALQNVKVYDCPRMHTFTLLEVSVPGVIVKTSLKYYWDVTDLNKVIERAGRRESAWESSSSEEEEEAEETSDGENRGGGTCGLRWAIARVKVMESI